MSNPNINNAWAELLNAIRDESKTKDEIIKCIVIAKTEVMNKEHIQLYITKPDTNITASFDFEKQFKDLQNQINNNNNLMNTMGSVLLTYMNKDYR